MDSIRGGIQEILAGLDNLHLSSKGYTEHIITYLHSQGLVQVVGGELPREVMLEGGTFDILDEEFHNQLKAGYLKVTKEWK